MPEVNLRNENPMTSNVHYYLSNFRYLHDHPVHIKQHVNDILYSTSRESTNSNLSPISYNSLHGIPISEYIYSWGKSSTQVMILDTESTSLESKPMTLVCSLYKIILSFLILSSIISIILTMIPNYEETQ